MPNTPINEFPPIPLEGQLLVPSIFVSAALLVSTDSRYLFQLRDDKLFLPLRNHWALFGGAVESGESGHAAILREIEEELGYKAKECDWFHEAIYVLPRHKNRIVRKAFYIIHISPDEIEDMILSEGAAMRLMTLEELLKLPRIAPWDLSVVLMHARQKSIFPDGW